MKKFIISLFFAVILIIGILSKLKTFTNNIISYDISNSLVSITKKENLKLTNENLGLQTKKETNIEKNSLTGKGFFINNKGYILTNKHIVNDYNGNYEVKYKNILYPAKVIKIFQNKDLSIIKIDLNNSPYLKIEKNPQVYIGEKVLFFKNNKFYKGVILEKNISLDNQTRDIISTNLKLSPGSSGTPLFNSSYNVIGVNTAIGNKNKTYSTLIKAKELGF